MKIHIQIADDYEIYWAIKGDLKGFIGVL